MSKAHVYLRDIAGHLGTQITVRGWAAGFRSSGKIHFLQLRDGTGFCQVVYVNGEAQESALAEFKSLTQESTVEIKGLVRADARAPSGFELTGSELRILHKTQDYPITPKEHGVDYLMSHRHLWMRSKKQHAVLRVRAELIAAIRDYFNGEGFTLVDAPIFTPSACEGTTTLFETQYFDEKAYLSQSGQLYMEAAAAAFGKAYCLGPTFRAEKSKTRRHLIEFWMVEPEVAFANLNDNMDLAEDFVCAVVQRVLKNCAAEFKVLERDTSKLEKIQKPFPRVHYREAVDMILKENPSFEVGGDFGAQDETIISSHFEKPVFVHRFPSAIKAFYMKEDPNEAGSSLSCDLIAPDGFGEIIGGGQREEDLSVLMKKIQEHGLDQKDFEWYLDLRKYGAFEHSGFGLGIERAVAWLTGVAHIRETIPFPRLYGRIYP